MTKPEIRKIFKQRRLGLFQSERMKLDDLLLIQFQQLVLPENIQTLLTYWPVESQAEVNTHLFTRYLEFAIPGLTVAFPIVDFLSMNMAAVRTDESTVFIDNMYGIAEPELNAGNQISNDEIDLVFVPLLAFDKMGYRVGYGKGFYDRYFQLCRKNVCKVGFSYFEPIDQIDDIHQFDIPLDYCITPERIYEF